MRTLTAQEILSLAELRGGLPLSAQALALLSAACPEKTEADLLRMSLGERDVRLMELREKTFGPEIQAIAVCPACGQKLDVQFRLQDLHGGAAVSSGDTFSCESGGYEITFRCPAIADLPGISAQAGDGPLRLNLLKLCIHKIQFGDAVVSVETLPDDVIKAVISAMAEADPMADVQLDVVCPECGNQWLVEFDIASYFLKELNIEAHELLRDVHVLASSYGWTEADVMNLSASRRNTYFEMIMNSKR